ncbi:ribosomal protein L15, putative [Theileria annulata]|uniref:Ribosomal protein L15, putative n=1 Tax=Theileria annulata TaxID=5874 RepID=Q4UHL9_THEAN|nr:ribosomal protein L15, putative [Theileria annulata]CAI73420.1 ribosomal protein L15, putative [Theileria annulata]|eukprot:XP_954097.1 ribosomal protein L15, putative [Theileria annulata]
MLKYNKIKFIFGNNFTHCNFINKFNINSQLQFISNYINSNTVSSITVTGPPNSIPPPNRAVTKDSSTIGKVTLGPSTVTEENTITTIKGTTIKEISTEGIGTVGPHTVTEKIRKDIIKYNEILRGIHYNEQNKEKFIPHPFNRRFAFTKLPIFPIEPRNLRIHGLLKKKKRGIGKKCNSKGIRHKHLKKRGNKPYNRTFEGGQTPLYKRLPKFKQSILQQNDKKYDVLNLCKLRYFIEKGRLDIRFPITQRHLYDSKCIKIKNGVHLFNVVRYPVTVLGHTAGHQPLKGNGYPFPYKIDISVASCDQSSIDVIKAVGGNITIIHYDKISLRAHIKPYKYEILPKSSRPDIKRVYELEKFRLMGCNVIYIKPFWLIQEENKLLQQFKELYQSIQYTIN